MSEPTTKAGRRLFTDLEPMDMLESDGVTWREVIAIEAEARQAGAREALDVARLAKALHMIHAATMAEVCGQPDTADAEAIAREYARLGREAP